MFTLHSTESRKRNSSRALIDDGYDQIPSIKEPHCSLSLIGGLDLYQDVCRNRIRTLSSQSACLSTSSAVSQLNQLRLMQKHRHTLKDVLFSPKVMFAFRNDSSATNGVPRGLYNLGNTCYMNAALQTLSNCPPIRDYFCLLNVEKNQKVNNDVSVAFRDLLNRLWLEYSRTPIKPINFLFHVRNKCPQFRGFGQQDSQEFIRCFLDVLHQELKYPVDDASRPLPSPSSLSTSSSAADENSDGVDTVDSGMSTENESPTNAKKLMDTFEQRSTVEESTTESTESPTDKEKSEDEKDENTEPPTDKEKPENDKDKPKVNYESVVSVTFDGQLISTVKCLTCQHLSHTQETFQDISLSIPTVEQLEKMKEALEEADSSRILHTIDAPNDPGYLSWIYGFTSRWVFQPWSSWISNVYRYMFSGSVSLENCMCAFFAADYLRGDDMYSCEKCEKLRNGVKQCRLKCLPEILCIHLKRFRHDTLYNTKINTRITFPLRDLDLQPYMQDEAEDDDGQKYVYDLIGVVSHRGSSVDFGHYIAYCVNQVDGIWYEFDDSFVKAVSEEEVAGVEAYVLFYQKRSDFALDEIDDF